MNGKQLYQLIVTSCPVLLLLVTLEATAAFTAHNMIAKRRFGVFPKTTISYGRCHRHRLFASNITATTTTTSSSLSSSNDTHSTASNGMEDFGVSFLENSMDNVEIVPDFRPYEEALSTDVSDAEKNNNLLDENEWLFVKMIRGSANYIAAHRGNTVVLHVPAKLIDIHAYDHRSKTTTTTTNESGPSNPKEGARLFEKLLDDIALLWLLGLKIVIVIGCRGLVDERLSKNINATTTAAAADDDDDGATRKSNPQTQDVDNLPLVFHKGLRVTNEQDLRSIKEIAGYARFEAERRLARALKRSRGSDDKKNTRGGNVVSGNFFSAQPIGVRDGIDYKYTGKLRRVEKDKIRQAHDNNDVVLLTSLGVSPSGEVFWVKSESLAAGVASSLGADKIIYLLEEPSHVREIDTKNTVMSFRLAEAKRLLANFGVQVDASTGEYIMVSPSSESYPIEVKHYLEKVGFSTNALVNGVKRAHLVCPSDGSLLEELYTRDDGTGTMISRDLYDGIRRANAEEVPGITELIQPLVDDGIIVERPQATLEKEINTFYVYTRDDLLLACGQVKLYEGKFAEIGCLAVKTDYRKSGKGDAMLCKYPWNVYASKELNEWTLTEVLNFFFHLSYRLFGKNCTEVRGHVIVCIEYTDHAMVY